MQVQKISHYSYNYTYTYKSSFRGVPIGAKLQPEASKGLKEIKHIFAGTFGTYIEGSEPLQDFACAFKPEHTAAVFKRGLSTNIGGVANCLLKTKWDNPVSTSGVFDCSVMYLANEKTHTHFLYHMYKDSYYDKITGLIKEFMPEGFTHASIIPGDKKHVETHKKYLYEVFKAIKDSNPDAEISAYHFSSKLPEVVGYKGKVYEIPRNNLEFDGQNSFKIQDIHYYESDLYLIDIYNSESCLKELSEIFADKRIDAEVQNAIQTYIKNKIDSLPPRTALEEFWTELKDEIRLMAENAKLIKNSLS